MALQGDGMAELNKIKREIIGDIWTSNEILENLSALCSFGSRACWTESEVKARDYILSKFREYGLDNVHSEEFEYLGWRNVESQAWIIEPITREIETLSCIYSISTAPAGIEGEVISIAPCTREMFQMNKENVKNKIVLTQAHWPNGPNSTTNMATEFGAKAVLLMNLCPNAGPVIEDCQQGRASKIPVAGISYEAGDEIRRLLTKGKVKVKLRLKNEIGNAKSWNVIAEIRGRKPEQVIVGAHFDSPGGSEGACDDAAGACVVMETARVLANHKEHFDSTVKFVCFAAEEPGELGSFAYADAHDEELREKATLFMCLDVTYLGIQIIDVTNVALIPHLKRILDQLGLLKLDYVSTYSTQVESDEFPFFLKGIPTVWPRIPFETMPTELTSGRAHCPGDSIDKVNPKDIKESAMVGAWIVFHAANSEKPWARRRTEAEVEKLVEKKWGEYLRMQGRQR